MLWQLLVIVIGSNLDDLGVGFSLGLRGRIPWRAIWIISILSGITMAVGMLLGEELAFLLPGDFPHYISALIFTCIGLWFIKQALNRHRDNKPAENNKHFSWKVALFLGLALGVDSFAVGFSGGLLATFPILLTSGMAWLTSFLFLWFGSRFGSLITIKFATEYADFFSGALFTLLAIGILLI